MTIVRFSQRIQQLRKERSLSLREVSRQMGFASPSYLADVEAGKFLPGEEYVPKFAALFGVSERKVKDWLVADRLTAVTGEKSPGISWFTRSLGDLDDSARRQAHARLLKYLAREQDSGDAWPDQFELRREDK